VNFITCHDGFTLWDLVSYNQKYNEPNGEGNRDGAADNYSWNCGVEGPTDDPEIVRLRMRQAKNLMTTLMVSQGVPVLLAGDEFLRTQKGNNNAWCQDNATSWLDWSLADKNAEFLQFTRLTIALRKRHPALRRHTFPRGPNESETPDIFWHGIFPHSPDFSEGSRSLALAYDGRSATWEGVPDRDLYIAMHASWESAPFRIPRSPSGRVWRRTVDTGLDSPNDAVDLDEGPHVAEDSVYVLQPHSAVILISEAE
jgi:glycogen operon protein